MAYSTAYVFYNGKIIHKYSKQVDAAEISAIESDGGKVIFIPGDRSAYFTVDGIDFALEICGEHAVAVRAHDVKKPVDVHIIVSATVRGNAPNYVTKNDGWVIHADAYNIYISQVNRGHSLTATDRTAPLTTLNANALGGQYLDEIKEAEAQLQSGIQELDANYAVPHSAYLKKNKLIVQRATAKMVQQTLVIS